MVMGTKNVQTAKEKITTSFASLEEGCINLIIRSLHLLGRNVTTQRPTLIHTDMNLYNI